jgi:8-oxo-dGTP pyrophosphatase MutT (NUDIX family)
LNAAERATVARNARAVSHPSRDAVLAELRAYVPSDDRERAMRDRIVAFVAAHADAFERSQLAGHVTASAWIVDRTRTHALLLHHRKLGRWLQPGGHADGDVDLRRAAMREAAEESGLTRLRFAQDAIYDVDVHPIPERPGEPAHEHFDVRFALEADADEPLAGNHESHRLAWVPLDALHGYAVDESVRRLARKTAALPRR